MTGVPDRVLDHLAGVLDDRGEPDLSRTKYRLLRTIGRGGMGVVYAAEDTELGREVAIKVSGASLSPHVAERLEREAKLVARLEHPGIVPVHDAGVLPDGRAYSVMKLVRGERLDAWAAAQTDLRVVLRLFVRVCEAVAFAHARGVLHRDLKPENVMVGELGEALVMDWGIAKVLGAEPTGGPPIAAPGDAVADTLPVAGTAAGTVLGTPAYMSPEQARGEPTDARSDVFGLGAILYALLVRRPPFERLEGAIAGAAPPPRTIDPSIPRPLESICRKAIAPAPADRYASALDLARDVGAYLDQDPVSAHREGPLELAARFASRHRVLLSLLGVYVVVRVLLALVAR